MSAVVAGLMFPTVLAAAVPSAAATDVCEQDRVAAGDLPATVSLDDCDLRGAAITAHGLHVDVPPPGQGRSVVGVTTDGEVSLEVSTSSAGLVTVETHQETTDHEAPLYAAAQLSESPAAADTFSAATTLPVPTSYMPTFGQTFELAGATVEPGEPAPGCDASAVGSLWYRIQRPGTLSRIKLRADVPLAVYRGTALGSLQRVACVPANGPEQRLTLAATGVHYVQLAVTQADAAVNKFAAHVNLLNGEMRPEGAPPCDTRVHRLVDGAMARKPLKWRFHAASTPPSMPKARALRGIKKGFNVITRSTNDCGMPDQVSARHVYLGTTRKRASLCIGGGADGVNSVSFGPAPLGMLGLACSAWMITPTGKHNVVESDMRLTRGLSWTLQPDAPSCRQNVDMDLVGVVAHEAGHVFGLDHAEGAKGLNQTMSPSSSACNGASRTLGRGDIVALRKLY